MKKAQIFSLILAIFLAIPSQAVAISSETLTVANELPYSGTVENINMSREQALAFADLLSTMEDESMFSLADGGNGVPVLWHNEKTWQWENGFVTELARDLNYSTEYMWREYVSNQNGNFEILFTAPPSNIYLEIRSMVNGIIIEEPNFSTTTPLNTSMERSHLINYYANNTSESFVTAYGLNQNNFSYYQGKNSDTYFNGDWVTAYTLESYLRGYATIVNGNVTHPNIFDTQTPTHQELIEAIPYVGDNNSMYLTDTHALAFADILSGLHPDSMVSLVNGGQNIPALWHNQTTWEWNGVSAYEYVRTSDYYNNFMWREYYLSGYADGYLAFELYFGAQPAQIYMEIREFSDGKLNSTPVFTNNTGLYTNMSTYDLINYYANNTGETFVTHYGLDQSNLSYVKGHSYNGDWQTASILEGQLRAYADTIEAEIPVATVTEEPEISEAPVEEYDYEADYAENDYDLDPEEEIREVRESRDEKENDDNSDEMNMTLVVGIGAGVALGIVGAAFLIIKSRKPKN